MYSWIKNRLARTSNSISGSRLRRLRQNRGLSTAELVGIIVIVGILGALGGTYITGLVSTANTNTVSQNASSLNSVFAAALAGGATTNVGVGAGPASGIIDVTSNATCIADLNGGVTVGGVVYQMSPKIVTPASYTMTLGGSGTYIFSGTGTVP